MVDNDYKFIKMFYVIKCSAFNWNMHLIAYIENNEEFKKEQIKEEVQKNLFHRTSFS